MYRTPLRILLIGLAAVPVIAFAHPGHGPQSFAAGLTHPLTGIDHLLAMLAVGWWSAVNQSRRWWLVPLAFAACTLIGALAGFSGFAAPSPEPMIALSLLVFGGLMFRPWQLNTAWGVSIAGTFALFHGYAHGREMPVSSGTAVWLAGMVAATLLLHLAGAAFGKLAARRAAWATRLAGFATALAGVGLLSGVVSA